MYKLYKKAISQEYTCELCDFKADKLSKVKMHMKLKHMKQSGKRTQRKTPIQVVELEDEPKISDGIELTPQEDKDLNTGFEQTSYERETTEKVEMAALYSCDKCEYDTEVKDELVLHHQKNIHNVKSQSDEFEEIPEETIICGQCSATFLTLQLCEEHINSHRSRCFKCNFETMSREELEKHEKEEHRSAVSVETEQVQKDDIQEVTDSQHFCYLCPFEATNQSNLEKHAKEVHEIIEKKCDKCEYSAVDKDIMKKHKLRHTGNYPFICGNCEFEATKKSILDDHIDRKHNKKNMESHDQDIYGCNRCENQYKGSFQFKYHYCQPVGYKYPCESCDFHAMTMFELLDHFEKQHGKTTLSCSYCEFKAEDNAKLKTHVRNQHGDSELITIVANQQLLLGEALEVLRQDIGVLLNKLLEGQNQINSEVFLMKEDIACMKNSKEKKIDEKKEPFEKKKENNNHSRVKISDEKQIFGDKMKNVDEEEKKTQSKRRQEPGTTGHEASYAMPVRQP